MTNLVQIFTTLPIVPISQSDPLRNPTKITFLSNPQSDHIAIQSNLKSEVQNCCNPINPLFHHNWI